ncbi:hypothetical protein AB0M80_39455 [Amycolatopsis sp. NPDC051045]|uniref:hypothetical protein n=1 Tax=Amycolatopsis sp. NPDC051045 TaxID=3156922 RepID=UPI00341F5732
MNSSAVEEHERELPAQRTVGWPEKEPDVVVDRVVLAGWLLDLADRAQLLAVAGAGSAVSPSARRASR